MSEEGVFVRDGDRFTATDLALGPWFEGALHGGAPAGLIAGAIAGHDAAAALCPARITYEFVRPVPLGALSLSVEVVRPGRRVALLDAVLRDAQDTEVVRARALLVAPSPAQATPPQLPPFPGPDGAEASAWRGGGRRRMFATDAMEIRFVEGAFGEPGAATAWFRLRQPIIAGEATAPVALLAAAGDFGNGISSVLSWEEHMFINPDLTLQIERPPVGDWVALQSQTRVQRGSVGVAESVLWDEGGRIGRASQSLLIALRDRPGPRGPGDPAPPQAGPT
jgi:hypothetical protein